MFAWQDGVAIDSVGLDFLREPTLDGRVKGMVEDYLHEAAMAHGPTSGTFYDPEGDGTRLTSLGVHEHWNNAAQPQYSGGGGIELVSSEPALPLVGDLDTDGDVDWVDLHLMLADWLKSAAPGAGGDLDGDGFVDFIDLAMLAENFGRTRRD